MIQVFPNVTSDYIINRFLLSMGQMWLRMLSTKQKGGGSIPGSSSLHSQVSFGEMLNPKMAPVKQTLAMFYLKRNESSNDLHFLRMLCVIYIALPSYRIFSFNPNELESMNLNSKITGDKIRRMKPQGSCGKQKLRPEWIPAL